MRKSGLSHVFLSFALLAALAAAALFSAAPVFGAGVEVDVSGRGAGYTTVLYNNRNGLPTSEANAIVQTAEGFIWIGSYSGLIRYDGKDFERLAASTGVSSVVSLFADSKNRLWVGTNDKGVAVKEGESFTFYGRKDGLNSDSIRYITEDTEGNILIATTMGLAYVDPEGKLNILNDTQINTQYIIELKNSSDGKIYGVTLPGALFVIENLRVTAYFNGEDLGYGTIKTCYPDPDDPDNIFLGNVNSDVWYCKVGARADDASTQHLDLAPLSYVNAIMKVGNTMWVCTDKGIGYFDQNGSFTTLQNVPLVNSIDRIMQDEEGNLWFTSSRQGVMKIVVNRFTDISELAGLEERVVNSTCKQGEYLYIGTDTGLVILDSGYRPVENELSRTLSGTRIRCITEDSEGCIWLCTYSEKGLVRYDAAKGEIKNYTEEGSGLLSNRVRMAAELSDGSIAIATNRGMNIIKDGAVAASYGAAQGISNTEILTIAEGTDGKLYLGSDGNGIYVVDGTKISRLGLEDGLTSEVVMRIKRDPKDDNAFWVISSSTIEYLEDGAFRTINNFPYSNNFDIYFDDYDRIWILSSNGIYVVPREELSANNESMNYSFYDLNCGLPCTSTANSFSDLEDGTLYISGSQGVSSININDESAEMSTAKLAIPFIRADERYIEIVHGEPVHVPHDTMRIVIYPYAFTYSLYNPYVSYRLKGFDRDIVLTTKQEMEPVVYTNLAGGSYTFELNLVNTMTGNIDRTEELIIIKDRAIYEYLWFKALLAASFMAIIALLITAYFRRKTKMLEDEHEKNRKMLNQMTSVFAECIDLKDTYTNGHSHRVARYTAMLAKKLGKSDEEVERIYNIALLHDIGKIGIPDKILNKPSRLDDDEYKIMKTHSSRGFEILSEVEIAPDLAVGAGYHHERIDGKGYPNGLKGDEIPEVAKIIAVADTFDAMYSSRPYRKKMELSDVVAEIRKSAGTQLDQKVVDAFLALVGEGAFDEERYSVK